MISAMFSLSQPPKPAPPKPQPFVAACLACSPLRARTPLVTYGSLCVESRCRWSSPSRPGRCPSPASAPTEERGSASAQPWAPAGSAPRASQQQRHAPDDVDGVDRSMYFPGGWTHDLFTYFLNISLHPIIDGQDHSSSKDHRIPSASV